MVAYEEAVVPVFSKASSEDLAALHCVSGCGLGMTMTLSPVEAGSNVAIGEVVPVGLAAVQGARIMGAAQVILVEPIRTRRELGLKLGATTALIPTPKAKISSPRSKTCARERTACSPAGGIA